MSSQVHSLVFPNGLVLVAEPMRWLRSAALTFLVPSGTALEPAERNGLGGMICELAQRGAGPRDSRQFMADLDSLGVERFESVGSAHTAYGGAMLAENLAAAIDIFADLLRRPHLPADQLEAARMLLLQELRAVDDEPAQKVMIELRRRHYPDPWGRPAHGEQTALERIDIGEVLGHYRRCYGPSGTIVGVAGRFDFGQLKDVIGRLLGDWQPQSTEPITESHAGPRYAHLPYDSNQTHIGMAYPSVAYRDPEYFQAWGAASVLGRGSSARLFTEVRERRGLCYNVYASYHSLRHRGAVFCYAGTSADRAQETLEVTLGELNRLAQGVEEEELARLKSRIKAALVMQQESSSARSSSIARDWYHLGRVRPLEELEQQVDGLNCRSINAYLAAHPPGDFTLTTLGPRELEVPDAVS